MKNIDSFVDRKFGRAELDYLHPDLEPVLKETYGIIVYQEQVMQIAQILSGYSLGEADLLRRAMGKKKKEEMDQQRVRFLEGAKERGVPPVRAAFIFDLVNEFAGYGFNKSHAAAYAVIAYRTGWLKANHPVAFMAALMSLDRTNTDKLAVFFQEARRMGIEVRPPDVNRSEADFSVEGEAVRYGLGAVRNVGFSAMEHVRAVRAEGGPFRDLFDFAGRVDPRLVNKRAFENLARAGAFDSLEPDRAQALAAAETLLAYAQTAHADRESDQASLFGGPASGSAQALERPRLPPGEAWDPVRRLDEELSAVGFYLSGHPLDDLRDGLARRGVVLFADLPARVADGAKAARMAAIVRRRQEKVSRRSGEKFAFLTLSDPSGEFDVLVPPKILFSVRDLIEPGCAVISAMKIEENEEGLRLIMESAEAINTAAVEADGRGLRIHLDGPSALAGLPRAPGAFAGAARTARHGASHCAAGRRAPGRAAPARRTWRGPGGARRLQGPRRRGGGRADMTWRGRHLSPRPAPLRLQRGGRRGAVLSWYLSALMHSFAPPVRAALTRQERSPMPEDRPANTAPRRSGAPQDGAGRFGHAASARVLARLTGWGCGRSTRRRCAAFLKVHFQTVLAPVVTSLLFMIVFSLAIGAQRGEILGVAYASFLAPGLVMLGVLNNAFANSSSSLIGGEDDEQHHRFSHAAAVAGRAGRCFHRRRGDARRAGGRGHCGVHRAVCRHERGASLGGGVFRPVGGADDGRDRGDGGAVGGEV